VFILNVSQYFYAQNNEMN